MSYLNTNNPILEDKTTYRVALHLELKKFLENGGTVKEYPKGHSIWSTNNTQNIKEKTLTDFEDELNPQVNKSIQLDLNAYERITQLKEAQKKRLKAYAETTIKPKPQKSPPEKPPQKQQKTNVERKIVKEPSLATKEVKATLKTNIPKQKNPTKPKALCDKVRAIKKVHRVPKPRTRSKTAEQANEYQRRMAVSKARSAAKAAGEKIFEAPCRIHGLTNYGFRDNDWDGARCLACLEAAKQSRKENNDNTPQSQRLKTNKQLLLQAIENNQPVFIAMCSKHGRSAHYAQIRPLQDKVKYEGRCCECKKYSKFRSERKVPANEI